MMQSCPGVSKCLKAKGDCNPLWAQFHEIDPDSDRSSFEI